MPATKIRTALRVVGLVWDEYFTAAVGFTGCPYRWVQAGSIFGEVSVAGAAPCAIPIGIIQNAPAAAGQARVRVMGKSIMAASMGACGFQQGTWIAPASGGAGVPSTCTLAIARWAGSITSSVSSANWGGYGDVWLLGPGFSTCTNSPC